MRQGEQGFDPRNLLSKEAALVVGALAVTALGISGEQTRRRVLVPAGSFREPPTMESVLSQIAPGEKSLGLKPGDVETLITMGDSTCYPYGEPDDEHESFTSVAARLMGVKKENTHNLGVPGIGIPEVKAQLHDPQIRRLLTHSNKAALVVCLNGNDWRAMVDGNMRDHLEAMKQMGTPTLKKLLANARSVFAVTLRHSDTASFFENQFSQTLNELAKINLLRSAAGKDSLQVVLTTPPNFADSPGITFVPTEGNSSSVSGELFDTAEDGVHRLVSVVSTTVAERVISSHRNFRKRNSTLPIAIVSLTDVVGERAHFGDDQHLAPDSHQNVGRLIAHAIMPQAA